MRIDTRAKELTSAKPRPRWKGKRRGLFHPNNPEKYEGNIENIVYRSHLELRMMKYFDDHPGILQWSSEEVKVIYYDPVKKKWRRYFVDFKTTRKLKDGSEKISLIEVKWSTQAVKPKVPKRQTRRYLREVYTWVTNSAKWEAAQKYCVKKGWEWLIITEKDLKPELV